MRVELSGRRINFPPLCPCCGEYPNADNCITSTTKRTRTTATREWQFPMRDQRQSHLAIYQSGSRMAVQVFDIPSESYATAFLQENKRKAVNLSAQAREALSQEGKKRAVKEKSYVRTS